MYFYIMRHHFHIIPRTGIRGVLTPLSLYAFLALTETRRPFTFTFTVQYKMDLQEVGCGGVDWIELA
jgi:hypothetical protein